MLRCKNGFPMNPVQDGMVRCGWCNSSQLYREYHDNEWGVPNRNSLELFELLCLEGAQAGLSWITILKKRQDYRLLFDGFDPVAISKYEAEKVEELVKDPRIIRHRGKVTAFIGNAKAYLELSKSNDFAEYLWEFTNGQIVEINDPSITKTTESEAMSKSLKKLGFKFVGPTICYAFMQAAGLVNSHSKQCWKYNS